MDKEKVLKEINLRYDSLKKGPYGDLLNPNDFIELIADWHAKEVEEEKIKAKYEVLDNVKRLLNPLLLDMNKTSSSL